MFLTLSLSFRFFVFLTLLVTLSILSNPLGLVKAQNVHINVDVDVSENEHGNPNMMDSTAQSLSALSSSSPTPKNKKLKTLSSTSTLSNSKKSHHNTVSPSSPSSSPSYPSTLTLPSQYHYKAQVKWADAELVDLEGWYDGNRFLTHNEWEHNTLIYIAKPSIPQGPTIKSKPKSFTYWQMATHVDQSICEKGDFGRKAANYIDSQLDGLKYKGQGEYTYQFIEGRKGQKVTCDIWESHGGGSTSYGSQDVVTTVYVDPITHFPLASSLFYYDVVGTARHLKDLQDQAEYSLFESITIPSASPLFHPPLHCVSLQSHSNFVDPFQTPTYSGSPKGRVKGQAILDRQAAKMNYQYSHASSSDRHNPNFRTSINGMSVNPFDFGVNNPSEVSAVSSLMALLGPASTWEATHADDMSITTTLYQRYYLPSGNPLPLSVDWRTKISGVNVAGPIFNQGHCGSCWAWSTAEMISSHMAIATGHYTLYSAQQVEDCSYEWGNNGCAEGDIETGLAYVAHSGGLLTADVYPMTDLNGNCRVKSLLSSQPNRQMAKIVGLEMIRSEKDLLDALATRGPVGVHLDWNDAFSGYSGGIVKISESKCNKDYQYGHELLAIGYTHDETTGEVILIIKNQYGKSFGSDSDEGIFYLALPLGNGQENICGIVQSSAIPVIELH